MNYETKSGGSLRVELQDAAGKSIPGFTLDNCRELSGDEIERIVEWKKSNDVSELAGQPIRSRIVLENGDLYSFNYTNRCTVKK